MNWKFLKTIGSFFNKYPMVYELLNDSRQFIVFAWNYVTMYNKLLSLLLFSLQMKNG